MSRDERAAENGRGDHHADEYRESIAKAHDGSAVQVEEYPGGDMLISRSDGGEVYFTSDQAAAFRSALGRIDAQKGGADDDGE